MTDLRGTRELPLEGMDIGTVDEGVVANDGGRRAVDLALDGLVLQLQIGKGYGNRGLS